MRCPKCGAEDDGLAAIECPRCGVVFAKIRSHSADSTPQATPLTERRRASSKGILQWVIGSLVAIAIVGSWIRKADTDAGWYKDASGYDRGVAEHNSTRKPLLIYFYTDWCPHCRDLQGHLFSSASFRERSAALIKVKVNIEGGSRERAVAHQFYSARYIPALYLVDETGTRVIPAYRDAERFFAAVEGQKPGDSSESERSRGSANEPHFLKGVELVSQGRRVEAEVEFLAAVQKQPAAESYDYLAWLSLEKGDWGGAVEYAGKIIKLDPDYDHGRGYALQAQAYRQMGKNFEASVDADRACALGDKDACAFAAQLRR